MRVTSGCCLSDWNESPGSCSAIFCFGNRSAIPSIYPSLPSLSDIFCFCLSSLAILLLFAPWIGTNNRRFVSISSFLSFPFLLQFLLHSSTFSCRLVSRLISHSLSFPRLFPRFLFLLDSLDLACQQQLQTSSKAPYSLFWTQSLLFGLSCS